MMRWDPKTRLSLGLLKLDYNTSQRHIRHVGGRSFELGLIGQTDAYKPGMILTAGPRAGHTILLSNSTACTVQGLTIHGTSDSTFSICRQCHWGISEFEVGQSEKEWPKWRCAPLWSR